MTSSTMPVCQLFGQSACLLQELYQKKDNNLHSKRQNCNQQHTKIDNLIISMINNFKKADTLKLLIAPKLLS